MTQPYYKLSEFAKTFDYGPILTELKEEFGWVYDKEEMDDIGLKLQICIKKSKPMYLHGYVLTSALNDYLYKNNITDINILETGTARGFSSICMAKILEMHDISGNIYTMDMIDLWENCLKAKQLNRSITTNEVVEEWKDIVEKYIHFIKGDSSKKLIELDSSLNRIHFAFLDGAHSYDKLMEELLYVEKKQLSGDVIICDDYTKKQYPQLCKAMDDFFNKNTYQRKIFYGNDGIKKRGYVCMIKI